MKKIILFLTLLLSSLFFVNNTNAFATGTLVASNFGTSDLLTVCNASKEKCYFLKGGLFYKMSGVVLSGQSAYTHTNIFIYGDYIYSLTSAGLLFKIDTVNDTITNKGNVFAGIAGSPSILTLYNNYLLIEVTWTGSKYYIKYDFINDLNSYMGESTNGKTALLGSVGITTTDFVYDLGPFNYKIGNSWYSYYGNNLYYKTGTSKTNIFSGIPFTIRNYNIFSVGTDIYLSYSTTQKQGGSYFFSYKNGNGVGNFYYYYNHTDTLIKTLDSAYLESMYTGSTSPVSIPYFNSFTNLYDLFYVRNNLGLYLYSSYSSGDTLNSGTSTGSTFTGTTSGSSNFTIDIPDNKCISSGSGVYRMNHNLNRFTSGQLQVTGLNQYNFTFSGFNYNINDTYTFSGYADYELRNADGSLITNNRDTVFYDDKKYFYLNEAILGTTYEYMEIDIPDGINYIKLKGSNFEYRLYGEDNKNLGLTIKGLPMTLFSNRGYLLSKNIKKFRIEFANGYEVGGYKINNFDFQKILVDMICYNETTETYTKNGDPYSPSDDEKSDIIGSYPNEENTTDSNSYISQIFGNYYDVLLNFFSLYDVVLPSTPDLSFQFSVPHLNNHFKPYLVTETITLQPVTDNLGVASDMSNGGTAGKYFLAFMLSILYFFTRLILIGLVFLLFYIYWISVQKLVQAVFGHDFKNNPAPSNGIGLIVFISLMIVVLGIFFSIILYITPIYDFLLIVSNITTVGFSFAAVILGQYSFFQSIVNLFYAGVIATFLVYITWLITLKFGRVN